MTATEAPSASDWHRQVLETAPDAIIVVDRTGALVYANAQTEALFGYSRAQLIGQPLSLLLPERFAAAHQAHCERYFATPSIRPMGTGLELSGRHADGHEVAMEVSLSPVHTSSGMLVSAAIRDISDRKRLLAEARLLSDRLMSSIESGDDALALYDADERMVLCNSMYRRLVTAAIPGAVIGLKYETILDSVMELVDVSPEERDALRARRLADFRNPGGSVDVRRRDGRTVRVMNRRSLEGGIVQTIWDISDDAQRERELREARAEAEAASAAKTEFLSSMSHELRTPLNAILGFAQLLQRDRKEPLSPRHNERAAQIVKGGEHLLRLIDDILDLSRIEAGGVSVSTEPVGVPEVIDEIARALQSVAAPTDVRVQVVHSPEPLPMVSVDRTRFVQILMNFGSNAIKYNRPGGLVTLSAVSGRASEPGGSAGRVRVTVTDTGEGIAPEKRGLLFQPFQRAGQETGPIEGTGIGLVIAKRLAELMGGCVGFDSVSGVGSTFWVEVPVHASRTASTPPAIPQTSALPFDGTKRVVLYVEDNPANVTFMRDLMADQEGIELLTAPTAEMGLELAVQCSPALILMDINLPGMSGIAALAALQANPKTRSVPVVALTAAASERERQRGLQAGFAAYLTKPVNVDMFVDTLTRLLRRER